MKNRLLVSNLPSSATPEALRAFVTSLGHAVQGIDFGPNEKWRLPRGYALVTLANPADSRQAINDIDGKDFQGQTLAVEGARPLKWRHRSERAA